MSENYYIEGHLLYKVSLPRGKKRTASTPTKLPFMHPQKSHCSSAKRVAFDTWTLRPKQTHSHLEYAILLAKIACRHKKMFLVNSTSVNSPK